MLRYLDTEQGDLALAGGRPADALGPYARSLERAQDRGDSMQIAFDLRALANALAMLGRDDDALTVLGLGQGVAQEVGRSAALAHPLPDDPIHAATTRLGAQRAEALLAAARAVPAGLRVARALTLAIR